MRVKLDENLAPLLTVLFIDAGHDAETVLAESLQGAEDEKIFQVCQEEHRCLVTMDLDFANPLRFPPSNTPGIIVLRPPRPILPLIKTTVEKLLTALSERNISGKLWIVEHNRIREYVQ